LGSKKSSRFPTEGTIFIPPVQICCMYAQSQIGQPNHQETEWISIYLPL
jgi:hypothetical protein